MCLQCPLATFIWNWSKKYHPFVHYFQNLVTIAPFCTYLSRHCHSCHNGILLYKDFKILPQSYVHITHNSRRSKEEEEKNTRTYTCNQTQGSLSLFLQNMMSLTFIWNFITWNICWEKIKCWPSKSQQLIIIPTTNVQCS